MKEKYPMLWDLGNVGSQGRALGGSDTWTNT